MNITVKNIPDLVYETIKQEAKRKGRSLNAEIIKLLEAEAADANRRVELRSLRDELDRFAASLPPMEDSTPLIRRGRDEH